MITHIKVENYLSYNKETIFSFACKSPATQNAIFKKNTLLEKSSGKALSFFNEQGRRKVVMNSLAVYGSNASGKSNIVSSMKILNKSILDGKIDFKGNVRLLAPFQFVQNKNPISKLEIGFIDEVNDKSYRFIYRLEIDGKNQAIAKEVLSYSSLEEEKLQIIFERSNGKLDYVEKDVQKIFWKILLDNIQAKPLLTLAINNINRDAFPDEVSTLNYKLIECAFDTIANKIVIAGEGGSLENIGKRLNDDEEFKSNLLTRLSDFDFSISDIKTEDITSLLLDRLELEHTDPMPEGLLKAIANRINKEKAYQINTKHSVGGEEFILPISLESRGTRKFITEFLYIYDVIKNGKLYVCDEFEAGYHNEIQIAILNALFEGAQESGSQFIIFTHNTNLLSPELFAKEQIVFVEKDRESHSSDIYKLSEYSGVTYDKHNWEKMYLEGRFGAIPEVY
ncbi:ATP/GTP-binding protein [Abiotrophia sp.]|uniref:AAA family ATPase n=1 Tax=Abiotrophia sp. TaxID=76631 RepID=UPI0027B8AC41|nr:AAA family ATPase [Abiotrophia sp.]